MATLDKVCREPSLWCMRRLVAWSRGGGGGGGTWRTTYTPRWMATCSQHLANVESKQTRDDIQMNSTLTVLSTRDFISYNKPISMKQLGCQSSFTNNHPVNVRRRSSAAGDYDDNLFDAISRVGAIKSDSVTIKCDGVTIPTNDTPWCPMTSTSIAADKSSMAPRRPLLSPNGPTLVHAQAVLRSSPSQHDASHSIVRHLHTSASQRDPAWRDSLCISVDCDDEQATLLDVDDVLFDMFKDEATENVHMGRFIAAITETGLRRTDPRLKEFRQNLEEVHSTLANYDETSVTALNLNKELFKRVIKDNVVLISRSLRHQFVIPQWADFSSHIEDFYWAGKSLKAGNVAAYIPQLARFSPEYWGVSVCSIDGQRFSTGDTNVNFTMQSCSKPVTYAIALNELGAETVHRYVGTEPSGRMFNAIVLDYNNKPHNPLVNAGSIVVNALLFQLVRADMSSSEKFDFVQQYFSRMAGGEPVGFSNGTFLSERENADRNHALAYYMRENKCFPEKTDLMASLDLYFQNCSMEVTAESVAVMAATLANGGICPITGDQVLQPAAVRDVLSLMHSCGMYDYSGQFAFKVGLPAKSGVCGAIMLVIPNVVGICTWSPPLDALGNSVRGIKFCEDMVEMFNFHRYDNLRFAANKKDPRKEKYESRGQKVVSLLFSASTGDVTAMRRQRIGSCSDSAERGFLPYCASCIGRTVNGKTCHHRLTLWCRYWYALSGLNMAQSDYDGRTALHLAAAEGHVQVVKLLLEKCKVVPDPSDRWGRKPVDDAKEFGHTAVADYIRKYTAEHPRPRTPTEGAASPTQKTTQGDSEEGKEDGVDKDKREETEGKDISGGTMAKVADEVSTEKDKQGEIR